MPRSMSYGGTMVYYEVDLPRMAVPWYCTAIHVPRYIYHGTGSTMVQVPWYGYHGTASTRVRVPWYVYHSTATATYHGTAVVQFTTRKYHGTATYHGTCTTVLLWYNFTTRKYHGCLLWYFYHGKCTTRKYHGIFTIVIP